MEGGPPVFRVDSSCPHVLRIPPDIVSFAYRILTFYDRPSHAVLLAYRLFPRSLPRQRFRSRFGLPALSLAATQGVPLRTLGIHVMIRDSSSRWCPNSDPSGSKLMYSSPELFAACRVLRRLLMPRHSPYALLSLNFALFARSASQCSEFLLPQKLSINSLRLHNLSSLACFSLFLWLKLFTNFACVSGYYCSFNFTHAIQFLHRVTYSF